VSRAAPAASGGVTVVTQTRPRDGMADAFSKWQTAIGGAAAAFPGFIEQSVMPPSPPAQVDWVILQRFASADAAVSWLRSERRTALVAEAQPMLLGRDDVHLVRDREAGVLPAPVSAVFATRLKPGREAAFKQWEQRIAAAQVRAPGFQGYRFEPPIPGVQEDWLAILRFDSEPHLNAWLESPERQKLVAEAASFTEDVHMRVVRTGFEQWFAAGKGGAAPAAWKQNMMVLLLLYPIVFLFGLWVQNPLLIGKAGLPFWLALFIGNMVSVLLLSKLVPWISQVFGWWLQPGATQRRRATVGGAALVIALYAAWLALFSRMG
jgi:antibiotic biosynthesis monooxygenase (ABM) superfamily enzyme